MKRSHRLSLAAVLGMFAALVVPQLAGTAFAQDVSPMSDNGGATPAPTVTGENDSLRRFWQIEIGSRTSIVRDPGYDTFSKSDGLPQLSLGFSRTVFVDHELSIAIGAHWDYGGQHATARGSEASISVHRLSVPVEARLHVQRWMYAFVRLAPGTAHTAASIQDASSSETLVDSAWTFSGDASVGAAFLMGPHGNPTQHTPRFWGTMDFGYGYQPGVALRMHVQPAEDDPRQYGSTTLRPVALSGVFVRLGLSVTL